MKMQRMLGMLAMLMAIVTAAPAAPGTIQIQGKLVGSTGRPLSGARAWQVVFFNAPTGGVQLGAPLGGTVTVAATGRFVIEVTPPAQVLAAAGDVYYSLGIDSAVTPDGSVGSTDFFAARVKVTSALWAQKALDADRLDGVHANAFATTASLLTGLAGKADSGHSHPNPQLQNLPGALTDAQVPDTIRILNADRATSAAFAARAAQADAADEADEAAEALHALLSDRATTASFADRATTASFADRATTATFADRATTATFADRAALATLADNATHAAEADNAAKADDADHADDADTLDGQHAAAFAAMAHFHDAAQIASGQLTDAQVANNITLDPAANVDGAAIKTGTVADARVAATLARDSEIMPAVLAADGSASGLDADRLDGQDASAFATAAHTHAFTEADTLASVTARGATTGQALSLTNATNSASTVTGALTLEGGAGLKGNLHVGGNIYTQGSKVMTWQAVTANVPEMVPGTGYLANHAANVLSLKLPSQATSKVGDIVRVSGAGLGGWSISGLGTESVLTRGLDIPDYKTWSGRMTDASREWWSIAMSSDGTRLVAAWDNHPVYTSTDGGITWQERAGSGSRLWGGVASSADGMRLAALSWDVGLIYVSTDGGATWTGRGNALNWREVAISADGSRMVACSYGEKIYISTDGGVNWVGRDSNRQWRGVAMSADGMTLVAAVYSGQIYVSTNGGTTWSPCESARYWRDVAISADGARMAACIETGQLYISDDGGATWTARENARTWSSIAMSADGLRLIASVVNGQLYTSSDGGVMWKPQESIRSWRGVAMSADGEKVAACVYSPVSWGHIFTCQAVPKARTTGSVAGYLSGGRESAIELQHAGGGLWIPLSHSGALGAN